MEMGCLYSVKLLTYWQDLMLQYFSHTWKRSWANAPHLYSSWCVRMVSILFSAIFKVPNVSVTDNIDYIIKQLTMPDKACSRSWQKFPCASRWSRFLGLCVTVSITILGFYSSSFFALPFMSLTDFSFQYFFLTLSSGSFLCQFFFVLLSSTCFILKVISLCTPTPHTTPPPLNFPAVFVL